MGAFVGLDVARPRGLHPNLNLQGGGYNCGSTAIRPPLVSRSTALRTFDDLRYDGAAALRSWLAGVAVTLMTFDKQSNGRRTAVESKSSRSCNDRIRFGLSARPDSSSGQRFRRK